MQGLALKQFTKGIYNRIEFKNIEYSITTKLTRDHECVKNRSFQDGQMRSKNPTLHAIVLTAIPDN